MNLLIKSAKIIDPNSPHNGKKVDILIEEGIIVKMKEGITEKNNTTVFEAENLHVSPGWFDMHVNFRDPGFEYKEDLASGTKAAAYGGFTGVACMPSTLPPIHTKSEVEYIKNKTTHSIVDVYPIGALSYNLDGKDLSEMYDMHLSGAVAFSDDKKSIANPGLLCRALLYSKNFNGLIISFADDKDISLDGKMNEGIVSTSIGLKGMPSLAEEIMIARDIFLAEYTESKIHFSTVSTAMSVALIRAAKAKGLNVTSEVSAHQLALNDSSLNDFDSNYKVNPPLRTIGDIEALIQGLSDGTIDVICSDHSPEDEEMKKREFDHAAFGIIGLETAFAVLSSALHKKLTLEQIIGKIAINPRKILNLDLAVLKEGENANITFFNPSLAWTFKENNIQSKSKNTPFIGMSFTGKALGIYNKKQFVECKF